MKSIKKPQNQTNPMGVNRFKSKVDWWIGAILGFGIAITLYVVVAAYRSGDGILAAWVALAFVVLIYGGFVFPMRYELKSEALVLRFGLISSTIPYETIQQVVPTRSAISSLALSLDRLHIDSGSSCGPHISPKDKEGFLNALVQKTPHLRLAKDRLVPVDG
jgi:membrane protein YdbS with pleckstrin-like domain